MQKNLAVGLSFELLNQGCDPLARRWQLRGNDIPDELEIDAEVIVDEFVAHPRHLAPGQLRRPLAQRVLAPAWLPHRGPPGCGRPRPGSSGSRRTHSGQTRCRRTPCRWPRGCAAGRRPRPSECDRLIENAVAHVWRQAALGEDIYLYSQALLQVVGKRDQVEKAAAFRHIDEKVEVAGRALFAASHRAERRARCLPHGLQQFDAHPPESPEGQLIGGFFVAWPWAESYVHLRLAPPKREKWRLSRSARR